MSDLPAIGAHVFYTYLGGGLSSSSGTLIEYAYEVTAHRDGRAILHPLRSRRPQFNRVGMDWDIFDYAWFLNGRTFAGTLEYAIGWLDGKGLHFYERGEDVIE